jgi:hypothetical protein
MNDVLQSWSAWCRIEKRIRAHVGGGAESEPESPAVAPERIEQRVS